MDKFSQEEINLMCIYDIADKISLLEDLQTSFKHVFEPEMIDVFVSTIEKLENITDDEFADIGFYLADEFDEIGGM